MAWHVVQTAPSREQKVAAEIERLGMGVYCPVEPYKVRVNPRRHRTAFRPMLPGYLFAGFDADRDRWQAICEMRYARRLFMIDLRPVPVPDPIIERIAETERELGTMRRRKREIPFHVGQIARAKVGPMVGFFGTIADVKRESVCVEFSLFGRSTRSWLRADQIEAV